VEFQWKKIGETEPKLKMSYNIGIPEWQMDVTTGDFADDLNTTLISSIIQLSEIFIPLFLGFLAIVYVMRRSLTNLLTSLCKSMHSLAQGDCGTEIVGLDRRDEIGQMAEALVVFCDAGIEKIRLEKEAASARAAAEAERERGAAERARAAEEQAQAVSQLGDALKNLAAGDLTTRLGSNFSQNYVQIRNDFNDAIDKLKATMLNVVSSTDAIQSGSQEISTASEDLSRRTEQ